jgi:hypothetical protein
MYDCRISSFSIADQTQSIPRTPPFPGTPRPLLRDFEALRRVLGCVSALTAAPRTTVLRSSLLALPAVELRLRPGDKPCGGPTVRGGLTGKSFHHQRDHPKVPSNDAVRDCVRAPCAAASPDPFRSHPTHWPNALSAGSILADGSAIELTCLVAGLVWLDSFPESCNLIEGAQYADQILLFAPVARGQERVGLFGPFGLIASRSIPPIPDPK